ncbi:MAG: hypothetical protein Q8R96_15185 [Bacteroidota bacterium]|nr:hypothetical protein [Bacteroidota bacterium]
MIVDLLRRTDQFYKARLVCNSRLILEEDELLRQILIFQDYLIDWENTKIYTVDDAIEYYTNNVSGRVITEDESEDSESEDDNEYNEVDEYYQNDDSDRDYFNAMTDGQLGDYDDFIERDGNMDDIEDWARG